MDIYNKKIKISTVSLCLYIFSLLHFTRSSYVALSYKLPQYSPLGIISFYPESSSVLDIKALYQMRTMKQQTSTPLITILKEIMLERREIKYSHKACNLFLVTYLIKNPHR